jgi:hypothetical protein
MKWTQAPQLCAKFLEPSDKVANAGLERRRWLQMNVIWKGIRLARARMDPLRVSLARSGSRSRPQSMSHRPDVRLRASRRAHDRDRSSGVRTGPRWPHGELFVAYRRGVNDVSSVWPWRPPGVLGQFTRFDIELVPCRHAIRICTDSQLQSRSPIGQQRSMGAVSPYDDLRSKELR